MADQDNSIKRLPGQVNNIQNENKRLREHEKDNKYSF